jgi:alpha-beta hydrolase superfamily lysophospholipase
MRRFPLLIGVGLLALCVTGAAAPRGARDPDVARDPLAGTWRGGALYRGAGLELSVRFIREAAALRAELSCPDMMVLDQPLDGVKIVGSRVRFSTRDDHPLRFEGVLAGDSIRGTARVPVVAGVTDPDPAEPLMNFALGRASTPAAPPYATREVTFTNGAVRLAGTLFVPASGAKSRAGIVLLQGSSTNLRRDYLFQVDRFARAGLEVLAFDKRGCGESGGNYPAATYDQLAADAAASVEFLRHQPGVDAARVGVWGISQGAFIAPLVAARVPALRFIVAVSGPGLPIGEGAAYQDSMRLVAAGFDAADIVRAASINRRMVEWLRTGSDTDELSALLSEAATTAWRKASSIPARLPAGAELEGWYWRGRTLDPAPWWEAVRVPVLALYGAADELVPARASAKAVEKALHRGHDQDVTVRVFPNANHVLRTLPLVAGGAWDWPRAAPGYLDLELSWILQHAGP